MDFHVSVSARADVVTLGEQEERVERVGGGADHEEPGEHGCPLLFSTTADVAPFLVLVILSRLRDRGLRGSCHCDEPDFIKAMSASESGLVNNTIMTYLVSAGGKLLMRRKQRGTAGIELSSP